MCIRDRVYIYEKVSGNRVWPEDGTFALSEGFTYQCTVTKVGYIGKSGELALANGVLTFDEMKYEDLVHIAVKLEQAAKDSLSHNLKAEWPDFRGDPSNNAVTDVYKRQSSGNAPNPNPQTPARTPRLRSSCPSAGTCWPSPSNSRSAGTKTANWCAIWYAISTNSSPCFRVCSRPRPNPASPVRSSCSKPPPPEPIRTCLLYTSRCV